MSDEEKGGTRDWWKSDLSQIRILRYILYCVLYSSVCSFIHMRYNNNCCQRLYVLLVISENRETPCINGQHAKVRNTRCQLSNMLDQPLRPSWWYVHIPSMFVWRQVEKDQAPNIRKTLWCRLHKRKASQQQEHAAFDKSCALHHLSAENVEMTHQNRTLPQYLKPDERVLSARIWSSHSVLVAVLFFQCPPRFFILSPLLSLHNHVRWHF